MIEPARTPQRRLWDELLQRGPRQLELPLEGLPSARKARIAATLKDAASSFAPRLGSNLLMRVGVPMVATTTPIALGLLAPDRRDSIWANLAAGSALGGIWGAAVGAVLPYGAAGEVIPRSRAMGHGAATGVVLAPAIAVVSKYVVDWITRPVRVDQAARSNGS